MARPRWQTLRSNGESRLARRWDQFVALWASLNLLWICFDISYVPLRTFWLQRNLYPLPSVPLVLRLRWLPNITPLYDPIKGIEPHRETQAFSERFNELDQALTAGSAAPDLRRAQVELAQEMIAENPFLASGGSGTLEKIKNRLRDRADLDSSKESAAVLLSDDWLAQNPLARGTAVLAPANPAPWWPPITGARSMRTAGPPTTSGAAIYFFFRVSFWSISCCG